MKGKVGIIGAGMVGTAMGVILKSRGYEITGVASRTAESRRRLAVRLQCPEYSDPAALARGSEILLIATKDSAIAEVAAQIAGAGGIRSGGKANGAPGGQVVIHFSGALGSDVLEPVRAAGAYVLSVHPLQSFASAEVAVRQLPGSVFTIEGDDEAVPLAYRLVADLGGQAFRIESEGKALYHAGACAASNYLVTLLDFAASLLVEAGIPREGAIAALLPLVEGTLGNMRTLGVPQALTGPIARGDAGTVAKHLESMNGRGGECDPELYSLLGARTIEVARRKGSITAEQAAALQEILERPEGDVDVGKSDHSYVS